MVAENKTEKKIQPTNGPLDNKKITKLEVHSVERM